MKTSNNLYEKNIPFWAHPRTPRNLGLKRKGRFKKKKKK